MEQQCRRCCDLAQTTERVKRGALLLLHPAFIICHAHRGDSYSYFLHEDQKNQFHSNTRVEFEMPAAQFSYILALFEFHVDAYERICCVLMC